MPAGQPRRLESGEALLKLWDEFCCQICDSGYELVPTQTAFCKWLRENYKDTDRRTIYNSLHRYFPEIKKDFERIQGDTVAQGAMLGKYQSTMSIFALKNWCNWGDCGMSANYGTEPQEDDPLSAALKEEAERLEAERVSNGNQQ